MRTAAALLALSTLFIATSAHAQAGSILPEELTTPRLLPPEELFRAGDPLGGDADFTGVTLAGVPMVSSQDEANARLEEIRAAAAATPATSPIEVVYLPSERPELAPVHAAFSKGRYFEPVLGVIAQELDLPVPLRVVMADCKNVNASYIGGRATLVMCHEVVASFVEYFRPKAGGDAAALGKAVVSATVFTLLHEVGHGLIELLRLPVIGNEEDAADRIAAVYLLRDPEVGAERAMAAADATGALSSIPWDVHPMSAQRRYNVMCLALGALNDPRVEAIGEDDFNAHRLPGCPAEFANARGALDQLLAPHYRWRKSPRLEALRISNRAPTDSRAPLPPVNGWSDPYAEALAYHAKVVNGLAAILAQGGDADACALFVIKLINANRREMGSLRAVLTGLAADRRQDLTRAHIFEIFDLLKLRKELRDAHPEIAELAVVEAFFELVPVTLAGT